MYKIKFLNGAEKEFETLVGADLRRANLREANLEGINLIEANLYEANLRGANLEGTNLMGATLVKADLYNTSIISFQLGKHFAFLHEGYLKIGCIGNTLEWWVENFKSVGKEEGYTDKEIKRYGRMIKLLSEDF